MKKFNKSFFFIFFILLFVACQNNNSLEGARSSIPWNQPSEGGGGYGTRTFPGISY